MPHVFISYSRKNETFVKRLERDLIGRGIVPWRDQHSIVGGEEWFKAIKAGLCDSYAVVYIDTPEAESSKWVTKEYLYAEWLGLKIIPVRLDARFVSMQTIDLNPILCDDANYENGMARVAAVLDGLDQKPPAAPQPSVRKGDEADYLDWVLLQWQADLRSARYVGLQAAPERAAHPVSSGLFGTRRPALERLGIERLSGEDFSKPGKTVPDARVPVRELHRVVLLGEPGAGKTTTLLQLAVDMAQEAKTDPDAKLPVFVPLRAFQGDMSPADFIRAQMATLQSQYERLLDEGRLVLLCDALNEMPRKGSDGRDLVSQVRDYLGDKPDWVVSCRVRDYQEDLSSLLTVSKVRLKPLDPPRIKAVIDKRFATDPARATALWSELSGSDRLLKIWEEFEKAGQGEAFWGNNWPDNVKSETGDFSRWWGMRHDPRRMLPLCRNPYMLFLVCEIFDLTGSLPANRGQLFATFVDDLLVREEESCLKTGAAWIDSAVIRAALAKLAYAMQTSATGTEISRAEAEVILSDQADSDLLLRLAASASLLDLGDTLRFTHQLLQEYFASEIMGMAMDAEGSAEQFWPPGRWWSPQGWEETALILAGVRGDPEAVARWIAPAQPEVAYRVLTESGIEIDLTTIAQDTRTSLIEAAKSKINEVNPVGRAAAYRVLGTFNADTRPGIGLRPDGLPDIDWVDIPDDGEWIYQDAKHPPLPAFQISRYPITYAQFQAFVNAPDFDDDRWWVGMPKEQEAYGITYHTREISEQYFKYANHPRDGVSWYQALAFCRWLTARLRAVGGKALPPLPSDWEITLPTEQQWEKAARGTNGRKYPYGNKFDPAKGNTHKTGIGQTSAVGLFPDGASPYGVLDMTGNVDEWCLNEYDMPEQTKIDDSGDWRVLRGGAWCDNDSYARAAPRSDYYPVSRLNYIGFRVVVRPPSQNTEGGLP